MTVRFAWALWLVLLGLLSLWSGAGLLQVLLVLFVPFLLLSFAAVVFASRLFSVSLKEEVSGEKGGEILLPITAENRFFLPLGRVSCLIEGENRLTGEPFRQTVDFSLGARERREIACRLTSPCCGRIEAHLSCVRLYEWFGLLAFPLRIERETGVTVLPATFPMRLVADFARSSPEDSDEYSDRRPGNDMSEIFQVRDYRPGDSLRQIHWKLTQKFDHLMTKEASLPVDRSILLLFDTARPQDRDVPPACFDAAAEVLVSLSQALLEEGWLHSIAWRDAATGGVSLGSVTSTEDLTILLPALLEGGCGDGISTLESLRTEKSGLGISRIIAVCAAVPSVPPADFGVETTVLCARSGGAQEEGGVLWFGSETYADELSSLILGTGR